MKVLFIGFYSVDNISFQLDKILKYMTFSTALEVNDPGIVIPIDQQIITMQVTMSDSGVCLFNTAGIIFLVFYNITY